MSFRLLELCWSKFEKGFAIGSFHFDDDTFKIIFGIVYLIELECLYIGLLGWNLTIEIGDGV